VIKSPCVRNCCLDDSDVCLGCFRSLQEIKDWGVVEDERRRMIVQNAARREEAHRARYAPGPRLIAKLPG